MTDKSLWQTLVAVSVSEPEDLLSRGFTTSFLNDICLQVSRSLLAQGASIAYGGILGTSAEFTESLWEAARFELDAHPSLEHESELYRPFRNYQPWPFYLDHSGMEGDNEVCSYVPVEDQPVPPPKGGEFAGRLAHACSRMRRWMASECHARVIVGGKNGGYLGVMPGVLEEALFHLEAHKPIYIVERFGGVAGTIAALVAPENAHPDTLRGFVDNWKAGGKVSVSELLKDYPPRSTEEHNFKHDVTHEEASRSYERLEKQIGRIRAEGPENGLSDAENVRLMTSNTPLEIVDLISKGLNRAFPS